ncbi:MAG: hypothetical protein WC619_01995 [Patescibacteria group bacterium]
MLEFYLTNSQPKKLLVLDTETSLVQIADQVTDTPPYGEKVKKSKRKYKTYSKKVKVKKIGKRTARGDEKCSECGGSPKYGRNLCRGLCAKCYAKDLYNKKHNKTPDKTTKKFGTYRSRNQRNQDEPDNTPVTSAAHKYRCLNDTCGAEFTSVYEKEEAVCPECGRTEVEAMDI